MDFRILSLGKHNYEYNFQNINGVHSTFCYFDWFRLKTLKNASVDSVFDYDTLINERYNSEKGLHVHETMLLMSSDNDKIIDDECNLLYISLINVPMWNEIFENGDEYSLIHEEILRLICERFENYKTCIKLYRTFDHCDFVLICDGEKYC